MTENKPNTPKWRAVPVDYRRCAVQQRRLFWWKTICLTDNWQVASDMAAKLNGESSSD